MIPYGVLWTVGSDHRPSDLLSAEERRRLFGVLVDCDALARLYTFEPRDLDLILTRRE